MFCTGKWESSCCEVMGTLPQQNGSVSCGGGHPTLLPYVFLLNFLGVRSIQEVTVVYYVLSRQFHNSSAIKVNQHMHTVSLPVILFNRGENVSPAQPHAVLIN